MNYKDAGVNVQLGNSIARNIKDLIRNNKREEIISSDNDFAALSAIPLKYKNPVMVTSNDGVGTKVLIAQQLGIHNTIGIDLVAMCANDIITQGAEPLLFHDYFASGKLDPETINQVIQGIIMGCSFAGCSLVGGETAEMPLVYNDSIYDLAGFCMGVVERNNIISPYDLNAGDVVIGIRSSGVHSNGFSLINKVLKGKKINLNDKFSSTKTLGEELLTPTKIYVKGIMYICSKVSVQGIAHITGGGLVDNVSRIIPSFLTIEYDLSSIKQPDIFDWIKETANISQDEMRKIYNCGIGMVIIVREADTTRTLKLCKESDFNADIIGTLITAKELL